MQIARNVPSAAIRTMVSRPKMKASACSAPSIFINSKKIRHAYRYHFRSNGDANHENKCVYPWNCDANILNEEGAQQI